VACLALASIGSIASAAQAADGWSPAASMSIVRSGHTATVLASGKVLVAGGYADDDTGYTASAELYDPVSDTWSPAASMHEARGYHTATLLRSGKVLVAGGHINEHFSEPLTASAELYDPVTDSWTPAASLGEVRSMHTATLLANGKVLVTGGGGSYDVEFGHGFPSSAELYDPVGNTWSPTAGMSRARYGLTATLLTSGRVLVTGGGSGGNGPDDPTSAELYDPVSATWSPAANMNTGRYNHTATLLASGKVLVTGGDRNPGVDAGSELYDPAADAWSPTASMGTARAGHTATLRASGEVLVTGGYIGDGTTLIASAELYRPVGGTWTPAGSMGIPRSGHRATLLANGRILVTGGTTRDVGSDATSSTANAELYGELGAVVGPQTTITRGPGGVTPDIRPSFSFVSSDAGSTFECSLDHGAASFSSCASGVTLGPLDDGSYTFRVRGTDAIGETDRTPATRTFTIRAAPRATSDAYLTDRATALVVAAPGVLENDSDPGGDVLHAVLVAGPAHGTLTLHADGSLRYTPSGSYIGKDSFTYQASDGSQRSATTTVSLKIRAADHLTDRWTSVASMSTARDGHAATLLPNGKVLVTGGSDDSGVVLRSAQLYDPATRAWTAAASMRAARARHTALLLASGKVLVIGGRDGSSNLASTELYDPVRNTWSAAASMRLARAGHSTTMLANGKVLVTGGARGPEFDVDHGFTASAELYDPRSDRWSAAADMSRASTDQTATLLANGKVLVTSMVPDTDRWYASSELYDPAADSWSPAAPMSSPRSSYVATLLASGKVLVTGGGGRSAELYDPVGDTWSAVEHMTEFRFSHTATLLASGTILVSGGVRDDANETAELYDAVSDTWTPTASMSTARYRHTATLLRDGKVLVTGGVTFGQRAVATAEVYGKATTAPRAVGDAYTVDLGHMRVVSAPGVLRNDGDPDGDALRAVLVSRPAHGTLTLGADGSLRYKPAEDYVGTDAFRYKASDGALTSAAATVRLDVRAVCGGMAATKVGTGAADTITGTAGADVIVGLGGNDAIRGLAGNDRLCGGSGADSISAGAGADVLIGGSGKDVLRGDGGNDRLFGGAAADQLFGGDGSDLLDGGANAPDACQGGAGADTVTDSCEQVT
jgi:N-acetylneuraminic acid mutarotase